ncbi:hypothetical protein [Phytohabitans kaempferiae]|uniref:Uncharacterized protein n=1 Tax=Phytohabitans kaempferiae TaxID=1620943 RepID=A0ABV6M6E3_9ACTN
MVDRVRVVAQAILDRLGHDGPAWRIHGIEPQGAARIAPEDGLTLTFESIYPPGAPVPPQYPEPSNLSVVLDIDGESETETVTVYYSLDVPEAEAIAAMASQIQDHAVEAAWGQPLPRCPGHAHMLTATVVDDIAVWQCPITPGHHREPIV